MPQKFHLTLLIHAHQPCGNFEHVLEKAYDTSYLPFVEHLEAHPGVRLGLHYSGPLLTWIEKNRPEYFARLKKLVQSGQEELFGAYVAEDQGKAVWLYPGQKALRYLIPFGKVEDVIAYLRDAASKHPGGVAAMGDDMEKFGVWPGTHEHCYKDGWLSDFFTALEANSDWLEASTPVDYLETHQALGRADLPTASYTEMMEWALPTRVRQRYHEVLKEFSARPEVLSFIRGGSWRGFFRKYPESNLLHKK